MMPANQTAEDAYRSASVINRALPLGLTIALLIPYLAGDMIGNESAPGAERTLIYIWGALAVTATMGALWFWRARVEPLIDERTDPDATRAQLTAHLVTTWALIEAPALMGAVVYLLHGTLWVAIASLLLMWTAALKTRPQRAWYERLKH
jgi:hypothetical protein